MLSKTRSHHIPDTKTYLRELVDHYDQILNSNSGLSSFIKELIIEEKHKCLEQLRKIKEIEVEMMLMANALA